MKAKKSAGTRMSPEGPVRKGGTKPKPSTPKPDIKPAGQRPSKSVGQIAASRIGCPGVKMFRLSQLEPAGYNPRVITAEAMEGLTNSLSRFGCVEPIVVNTRGRKNVIVGGNQRFEALRSLGIAECLCVTVSCSRADEKLLNLTLNNPQIQGDFVKKIADYIEQLRKELPDDNDFLNLRIADLQNELGRFPGKTGLIPDDDIPRIPEKVTTKTGDLWILGKHRLLCGDSTKAGDIKRLMGRNKADMVFTDPPYGINLNTDFSSMIGMGKGKKYKKIKGDEKPYDPGHLFVHFKNCSEIFIWGADYFAEKIPNRNKGSWIVWDKSCGGCNDDYDKMFGSNFELCWSKTKHKRAIVRILWKGFFGLEKEDIKKRLHPAQKPVALAEWFIEKFSKKGGISCDPFIGTGWTIIAAEKLDRRCFAIEKEPVFVDVAIKRWEQWTGRKAKLERKLQ